mgnify:CR=1 FL=1|jgi:predicted Fe-Mo cluster-binding NifX family protein
MKIAISSQGKDMGSPCDMRFGRAKYFIVIDSDTGDFSAHDNSQNLNAPQGAGIQAAKNVNDFGADVVVSGNVGPKAFTTLKAAGISIYTGAAGTVQETFESFNSGKLKKTEMATVEGHW